MQKGQLYWVETSPKTRELRMRVVQGSLLLDLSLADHVFAELDGEQLTAHILMPGCAFETRCDNTVEQLAVQCETHARSWLNVYGVDIVGAVTSEQKPLLKWFNRKHNNQHVAYLGNVRVAEIHGDAVVHVSISGVAKNYHGPRSRTMGENYTHEERVKYAEDEINAWLAAAGLVSA